MATKLSAAEVKARAKAAVLGGIVADAATMPLHWIYDVPKINELLAKEGRTAANPEFYPVPSCPFYNLEGAKQHQLGDCSPYGEELYPLATSLVAEGGMNAEAFAQAAVEFFKGSPAYRNGSIRGMITAWDEGKRGKDIGHEKDFQANCFAKTPLLVARYAGSPDLEKHVEEAIRVQMNNNEAVAFGVAGAKLLERVVLGSTVDEALQWAVNGGLSAEAAALVKRALDTRTTPLKELTYEPPGYMLEMVNKHMAVKDSLPAFSLAVWCNGPACGNPAAFANVALAGATYGSYVDAVRANLMAGGDNCSRSIFIGALLAAQGGEAAIPEEWKKQAKRYTEYVEIADKLVAKLA